MRVILAFDYEEYESIENAISRSQHIKLRPRDRKKIFVIEREIPWKGANNKPFKRKPNGSA